MDVKYKPAIVLYREQEYPPISCTLCAACLDSVDEEQQQPC